MASDRIPTDPGCNGPPGTNGYHTPHPAGPEPPPEACLPPPSNTRRRIIDLAARLMAEADPGAGEPLTVVICRGSTSIEFTAGPEEMGPAGLPRDLGRVERAILRVAAAELLPAKVLAKRAGYKLNPHFRAALRRLCARTPPLLQRVGNDYRRAPGA